MRATPTLLLSLLSCLICATSASAAVRTGAIADPRDVPEAVSGPRQPDVQQVRVSYDEAGAMSVTVRLFEPYAQSSGIYPDFSVSISSTYSPYGYTCGSANGDVSLSGSLSPNDMGSPSARLQGLDGTIPVTRTISDDALETTFSFSNAQLAGRGYVCASDSRLYRPDPDGHCSPSQNNCQTIAYSYVGDTVSQFFFDGYAPARPACDDGIDNDGDGLVDTADSGCDGSLGTTEVNSACDDGIDNDGDGQTDIDDDTCAGNSRGTTEGPARPACSNHRDDDGDGLVDAKDPGCHGKADATSEIDPAAAVTRFKLTAKAYKCGIDTEVDVTPDLHPVAVFPFNKVTIAVKRAGAYSKTRRLPLGAAEGYRFAKLKPGTYKVTGFYSGDRFRKRSRVLSRTVKIARSCRSKR